MSSHTKAHQTVQSRLTNPHRHNHPLGPNPRLLRLPHPHRSLGLEPQQFPSRKLLLPPRRLLQLHHRLGLNPSQHHDPHRRPRARQSHQPAARGLRRPSLELLHVRSPRRYGQYLHAEASGVLLRSCRGLGPEQHECHLRGRGSGALQPDRRSQLRHQHRPERRGDIRERAVGKERQRSIRCLPPRREMDVHRLRDLLLDHSRDTHLQRPRRLQPLGQLPDVDLQRCALFQNPPYYKFPG